MKKIKILLSFLVVAVLFAGLYYREFKTSAHEETEFLFDTPCSIKIFSRGKKSALKAAFDEAARIHKLSNLFDDSSDVSKINHAAASTPIKVDSCIIEMLELAENIRLASDGAFDISIAPVSTLWNFDEESPAPPPRAKLQAALGYVGKDKLSLDKVNHTVTKQYSETKIDLGGIAKGFAADKAAEILKKNGVTAAIIDFGGNIITIGKNPKQNDGKWKIGLQKPFAPTGEYSKILSVGASAIATSGTYQRSFTFDDKLYHHIIDPKTGLPAEQDFSSVTVTAKSSAAADCLGTAIFILGKEKGIELAKKCEVSVDFLE